MWIKGWIPYEECYRVPLIVRWPGHIAAGLRPRIWCRRTSWRTPMCTPPVRRSCRLRMARRCCRCSKIRSATDWTDQILCAYYGGEFLYTQRIAITDRYKYVFNGFDYRRVL